MEPASPSLLGLYVRLHLRQSCIQLWQEAIGYVGEASPEMSIHNEGMETVNKPGWDKPSAELNSTVLSKIYVCICIAFRENWEADYTNKCEHWSSGINTSSKRIIRTVAVAF